MIYGLHVSPFINRITEPVDNPTNLVHWLLLDDIKLDGFYLCNRESCVGFGVGITV